MMARFTPLTLVVLGLLFAMAACSPGSGPAPVPSPLASSSTADAATPMSTATDVRTAPDGAAFVSPSGRIACLMDPEFVRCEYAGDKAWTAPEPDGCELDWGFVFVLHDVAYPGCVGDTIRMESAVDSTNVAWRRSGDPTVTSDNATLAALPYGSALTVGSMRCDSATTGVTCRNLSTSHGFSMAREAYSIF